MQKPKEYKILNWGLLFISLANIITGLFIVNTLILKCIALIVAISCINLIFWGNKKHEYSYIF